MKNRGIVVFLTILISALCIYYLSFTFIAQGINQKAIELARDESGNIDFDKKRSYLDSIWREPVFNFLGIEYTYKDIKETELNLGLDLQGGMHVTLEVNPVGIVTGLSGDSKDEDFRRSLVEAQNKVRTAPVGFVDAFYESFKETTTDKKLSYIFATTANKGRISLKSTDDEILEIIRFEVENAIERSFNILRTRIDKFGTSQPNIQRLQGTGRIQVELPGVDNPARVRKLLQGVAKLEFWEVHPIQEIFPTLQAVNDQVVKEDKANEILSSTENDPKLSEGTGLDDLLTEDSNGDESLDELFADADTTTDGLDDLLSDSTSADSAQITDQSELFTLLQQDRYGLMYAVKDTMKINRIFRRSSVRSLLPSNLHLMWGVKPEENKNSNGDEVLQLYPIKVARGGKAPLGGDVVTNARQDLDESASPAVSMQMNAQGAKVWRKLTSQNIDKQIAIVLDGKVYSAPVVRGEIPNGSSSISGNFTLEEAKDLANVLKAGALPAPTTIVEDVVIGPTLGKVAQGQGITSIVLGLGIVIVFMIAYYSGGGLVANVALFFNIFFILGILAQLNASLTLPGIAGIVLTIGMSIDANVLIFERIREELRNGAALKSAISNGYKKAYFSIVDANATTFLTGAILYSLGQGPVKGFAITLMIGIVCSFFSAVFITRVIVELLTKKGDQSKISFATPFSKNILTKNGFEFIRNRRKAYVFSGAFIAVGLIALVVSGLTLGVDFKGGRSYVVSFYEPESTSEIKIQLTKYFENEGTEVKTFGSEDRLKITTSYLIDDDSEEANLRVKENLITGLQEITGKKHFEDATRLSEGQFSIVSSSKVGATIASDIKKSSYQAGILAIIVIFLYILIRFRKVQFSIGAIMALIHDSLFVISAFAICNLIGISFEIDQVFIAALLTIIGYSINDTVVVFDRIRENLALKGTSRDTVEVFNESLNNTVSRTMITSVTTLIVILVLFAFGGAVLKGFSFALLIGVMIGTYSSLFIATPMVIDFQKNDSK